MEHDFRYLTVTVHLRAAFTISLTATAVSNTYDDYGNLQGYKETTTAIA